jgi:predicted Rossmann-fold nucleotide-binding protein
MKTNKIPLKPIYLYNSKYWSGLAKWIKETIVEEWKLGGTNLLDLFKVVDSSQEILEDIFGKEETA